MLRYREVITEQLMQACGSSCQPVWRQSKEMLKEEGIEVAAGDSSNAPEPAAAHVQVHPGDPGSTSHIVWVTFELLGC